VIDKEARRLYIMDPIQTSQSLEEKKLRNLSGYFVFHFMLWWNGEDLVKPICAVSGNLNLQVEHFTFLPSIADSIREASLVISHAGSGSIFETLRLGKPLIVVVNEDLMDNHQSELAEELAEQNHLLCAHPQTLRETVEAMDLHALQPYIPGEARPVVALINEFLGFPV
uniref:Glycosyl transferase family 28 C-terminal domain-containing protein n=1 Tax=Aegilops tauschii subsp. strangulata TaxID=200361 RepID=A0A453IVN8_AEGTS